MASVRAISRFPVARSMRLTAFTVKPLIHATKHVEVRGRLGEPITHDRSSGYGLAAVHGPGVPPRCAGGRRSCRRGRCPPPPPHIPCYGHGIARTPCVGSHFAYHHNKRLPVIDVNLERLIRIRAAT